MANSTADCRRQKSSLASRMAKGFWSHFRIPLPIRVVGFLIAGLALGLTFPKSALVTAMYVSGTYFPQKVVTFAAFLIFNLLAAAMAKLILFHGEEAGKRFSLILSMYVLMGAISLVWAASWLAALSDLPFSLAGVKVPEPTAWAIQIGHTFKVDPIVKTIFGPQ